MGVGRRGVTGACLPVGMAVVVALGVATGAEASQNIAYGYFTDRDGGWAYSHSPLTPQVLTSRLIRSHARYIKVGKESPPAPDMQPYYSQMRAQGLRLGVRLSARPPRSIAEIVTRARDLASSGWYQWIFLDGAQRRHDPKLLVHRLHTPAGGDWS